MVSFIPQNLCDRCQVLQFNDSAFGFGTRDESGRHYFQVRDLNDTHPFLIYDLKDQLPGLPVIFKSAQNGCAFCRILRPSIIKGCSHFPTLEIRVRLQLVFSPEGRFMSVLARVGLQLGQDSDETLLMFGVDGETSDPCSQWLRLQSAPEDDIFGTRNVEKVKNILQSIDSQEKLDTEFYPTRLIYVGSRDSDTCHLVVTDSDLLRGQQARYAALSYCWGPPEDAKSQFKTERATLRDRISGFKLATTSPIMQDAVEVCRSLDIPYIWVDAVCIVQDDRPDWEREAAQMTSVYRNACLTICTPTAASCREAFLGPRVSAKVAFRSQISDRVVGSYNIRPCGAVINVQVAEGDYESLDNSAASPRSSWWRRGWTFQELALSTRVLLFGVKLHLVFEDRFWSEGDAALTEAVEDGPAAAGMGGTFAVISVAGALESREDEGMWMAMVEQYTERQLTFESDRLPAMGGLARLAVLGRGDEYLAGIRKESLHRDLFWTPAVVSDSDGKGELKLSFDTLMRSLNTPDVYIAPSWSWARWKGKIRFDESPAPYGDHVPVLGGEGKGELEEAYEGVEARTSTSRLNPFGQVTEGSLRLTGKVIPVLPGLKRQEGFDNHRKMCNERGQYVADLTFDWDEPRNVVPFEKLLLVLIGSYWSWQAYKMARLYDNVETDDDEEDDTISDEGDIEGEINMDVDMDSSEEDDEQMDDFGSESEEISFMETLARDANADKFAYGLIIHPADAEGKFLRVGIFSSWPKGAGGLRRQFGDQQSRTVEII
ncbi:HET-domain-containing protein [Annulohypoxylon bovei var. microspora]|nr:HET-domain-containing protein [Annulohypoxylon bovei var. microspora]